MSFTMSIWLIIALGIGASVGLGFLIMAQRDIRSARYKVGDYIPASAILLMLILSMAYGLTLNPPAPWIGWLLLPFKVLCFLGVMVFSWLFEILVFSLLIRWIFPLSNQER